MWKGWARGRKAPVPCSIEAYIMPDSRLFLAWTRDQPWLLPANYQHLLTIPTSSVPCPKPAVLLAAQGASWQSWLIEVLSEEPLNWQPTLPGKRLPRSRQNTLLVQGRRGRGYRHAH